MSTLAPLAITFKQSDTLYSNALDLIIYPTPSSGDLNDMATIKDIRREPVFWMDYLPLAAAVLGGLIVLGLLFWWYSLGKKRKAHSRAFGLPPHELALKKLEVLHQKSLWRQGAVKAHCAEFTFILREYLEKRYQVPALESPSSELLRHLKETDFPKEMQADLQNVLSQTDLVKFAKALPSDEFYPYAMDFAKALVRATIPQPPAEAHPGNHQPEQ